MARTSLGGSLAVPEEPVGVVLVAVPGPAGRRDPARLALADVLHHAGFATLVASLSTEQEAGIDLGLERLAARVASGIGWMAAEGRLRGLGVGCLAEGAAVPAALAAMALEPERVAAFVGCGGRPDAAGRLLDRVIAPALLVAGAHAEAELEACRAALRGLPGVAELAVIEDADDPFHDPEALGTVAWLARRWFVDHLAAPVS